MRRAAKRGGGGTTSLTPAPLWHRRTVLRHSSFSTDETFGTFVATPPLPSAPHAAHTVRATDAGTSAPIITLLCCHLTNYAAAWQLQHFSLCCHGATRARGDEKSRAPWRRATHTRRCATHHTRAVLHAARRGAVARSCAYGAALRRCATHRHHGATPLPVRARLPHPHHPHTYTPTPVLPCTPARGSGTLPCCLRTLPLRAMPAHHPCVFNTCARAARMPCAAFLPHCLCCCCARANSLFS